jgi:two-component system OmpR family sensor kinase
MDHAQGRMNESLQFRLQLRLGLLILGAAAIASALAFGAAYDEAHELQDDLLRQIGAMFDRQHLPAPDIGTGEKPPDSDDESRVLVQLLTPGRAAHAGGPQLPAGLPDGLQTVRIGGEVFRVFVRTMSSGERIGIAQEVGLRNEIARGGALRTLAPILILVPVLLLAAADLVRKVFRPIRRLAAEVDQRREVELHPVPASALPAEVRPFVVAMNGLLDRIDQAMKAQRRFVADAAHELRSPMTALGLQAEALAATELPVDAQGRLATLRRGIERSRNLLEQMLALAQAQSPTPGSPAPVSLHRVFRDVIQDLLPLAEAKAIDLGVVGSQDAQLNASEHDLVALVRNLTNNAVRYSPPGGRVDLSISFTDGSVVVQVEDGGPGVPLEERERVFEPFYRLPGTEEIGSGLGLSIVRAIAERLGGHVVLADSSHTPTGLTVSVILPRVEPLDLSYSHEDSLSPARS